MSFATGRHSADAYEERLVVEADVAIIGAGAGGCAAAAALAEGDVRVAMFEEGRHWKPSEFTQDTMDALRELYQARGARSARGNVVMPLPGGRGVGGGTLVNSAICFRCPKSVLELWRDEYGVSSIDVARWDRYFERIWETLGVAVQSLEIQRLNNIVFKQGADALGLDGAFMPRSAPGCVGCGLCQYGCPTGGKASVDRNFLVEAIANGQTGVYADCKLHTAITESGRIVEVVGDILDPTTQSPRGEVRVRADTFILSAGPIGSALFLLANSLADNTHCGQHLVVHPGVPGLARYPFEIRPWHGVTQGYYVDCWDKGFLLQTYTVTPDQYFMVMPTAVGDETMAMMADLRFIGSAGTIVHDEDSEGRVRVTPVGADISYFLGEGDKRRIIDGIRLCGEVFFAAGAQLFMPGKIGAGVLTSAQEIPAALPYDTPAHHLQTYASHPMGTCRMGASDRTSVVDPEGRVWGWDNLRVADSSVFPTSLGVNPQVTTMAMGLMIGHSVAGV